MNKLILIFLILVLSSQLTQGLLTDRQVIYFAFDEGAGNITRNLFNSSQYLIALSSIDSGNIIGSIIPNWTQAGIIFNTSRILNSSLNQNYWMGSTNTGIIINVTKYGIDANKPRTFSMWINVSDYSKPIDPAETLFAFPATLTTAGAYELRMSSAGGRTRFFSLGNSNFSFDRNMTEFNSRWTNLVLTYNGSSSLGWSFYINGQLQNRSGSTPDTGLLGQFHIGITNSEIAGTNLNASVDEFVIWNRSLSDSEVSLLYNNYLQGLRNTNFFVNDERFNNQTFELSTENFIINITYDSNSISNIIGRLVYNNTRNIGLQIGSGNNSIFNATIQVPAVNQDTNKTFYWEFEMIDASGTSFFSNSSFRSQTVIDIIIDNCTINSIFLMNLTVKDEDNQNTFSESVADNVTVETELSINDGITFNQTFTRVNPIRICISDPLIGNNRLNALISYEAFDHVKEFHVIQNQTVNSSLIPVNITLLDLAIVNSQEFLITFEDETFIPVEDAIIDITRKYIGEATYKTVEKPITDQDGQTIGHFVLSDEIYTLIVSKNNKVLAIFNDIRVFCSNIQTGDCQLNLNPIGSLINIEDFEDAGNINYLFGYNDTTRVANLVFVSTDGQVKTVGFNITTTNQTQLCNSFLTAQSGTVTCTVPAGINGTAIVKIYSDFSQVSQIFITLGQLILDVDISRFILAIFIPLTFALIGFSSGALMIMMFILGLVFVSLLSIFSFGGILGSASAILWFIIAGAIIIYKINKTENK